jgi:phage gp29-like protein
MGYYRPQQSWRDHYNPLRGLSLQRIVSMEEAYERGDMSDLLWFLDHMRQTDVTVASAVTKRLGYVRSLDWEIRTIETADPYLAHEQTEVLRYAYDRISNLER